MRQHNDALVKEAQHKEGMRASVLKNQNLLDMYEKYPDLESRIDNIVAMEE